MLKLLCHDKSASCAPRAAGCSAKEAVARIQLVDVRWGGSEAAAFEKSKRLLHNAVKLAHPSSDRQMCLFSDASGNCCAALASQVP